MSTVVTDFPQTKEYQKYRTWILNFISATYGKDLSEVDVAIAPNFGLGGGGLYMKTTEGTGNLKQATRATGKSAEELKGKYVVVNADNMWSMKTSKLNTFWIMCHEFGHAVGESLPGREGYGLDEAHAWVFEIKAILAAYNDGTLTGLGQTKQTLRAYLTERKKSFNPVGQAQIQTRNQDLLPLITQLEQALA